MSFLIAGKDNSQDPWSKGARMQRYLKEQYHPVAATAAKSLQSCPTLCDSIDGSPSGSPVPGILRQEYWSGLPFASPMHGSEK